MTGESERGRTIQSRERGNAEMQEMEGMAWRRACLSFIVFAKGRESVPEERKEGEKETRKEMSVFCLQVSPLFLFGPFSQRFFSGPNVHRSHDLWWQMTSLFGILQRLALDSLSCLRL